MILDLIVSKNMARRQLNPGQRALMALEYERYYAEAMKPGRPIGDSSNSLVAQSEKTSADLHSQTPSAPTAYERKTATRAAQVVGASGRSVAQAKAVQRPAPCPVESGAGRGVNLLDDIQEVEWGRAR